LKTELWRQVLCWGTVITFLTAPFLIFILHIISDEFPESFHFSAHLQEYRFLDKFYQIISALVFGLAGLNTFDRHLERKSGAKDE
jgi:ABC-type glycerol-3-phosphate transport system permease component